MLYGVSHPLATKKVNAACDAPPGHRLDLSTGWDRVISNYHIAAPSGTWHRVCGSVRGFGRRRRPGDACIMADAEHGLLDRGNIYGEFADGTRASICVEGVGNLKSGASRELIPAGGVFHLAYRT